jgi:hypothetical protein
MTSSAAVCGGCRNRHAVEPADTEVVCHAGSGFSGGDADSATAGISPSYPNTDSSIKGANVSSAIMRASSCRCLTRRQTFAVHMASNIHFAA